MRCGPTHFHYGPFAEPMMVPTENAVPLGAINEADAGRCCAAGLQDGETLLVSGATGNYGSVITSAVPLSASLSKVNPTCEHKLK